MARVLAKQKWFCRYCPLFVTGAVGGINKTVPLQNLVTKPLTVFAKLLGQTGDLETHAKNQYHKDAVLASSDFLKIYHHPQQKVLNQLSLQRSKQAADNRERLKPISGQHHFPGATEYHSEGTETMVRCSI